MPGKRTRSKYKRVRKKFKGTPWWESKSGNYDVTGPISTSTPKAEKNDELSHVDLGGDLSPPDHKKASVSKRKLDAHSTFSANTLRGEEEEEQQQPFLAKECDRPDGYRLVDMACFGNAIESAHKCHKGRYPNFCHFSTLPQDG